jgi:hypothetical protein
VAVFISDIIVTMFKAHTHRSLARLVLVWFALFIGVAIASPILSPTESQMVCSGAGGMKMVASSEEDVDAKARTSMDCPLCAPVVLPVDSCSVGFDKARPLAHLLHPVAAALIASLTAPPLPSRGPPFIS